MRNGIHLYFSHVRVFVGTDNIPSRWLESLKSSEPAVHLARTLSAPTTQPADDHHEHGGGDGDKADDVIGVLQDPQLVRIDSLTQQRDIHNKFDKHLHGTSRSQCMCPSLLVLFHQN